MSQKTPTFWASNIRFLRNRKNFSQDELASSLDIKRSKLNAHENGQTVNPTVEDLVNFSAYFKTSIDALLKTDLSKLSETKLRELEAGNDTFITGSKLRVLATTVDTDNKEQIEFVPHKAKAGYLAGFSDPEFVSQLPVFHMPHLPSDRKFRMFPTTGDSMYPIPENAYIIANFVEDWMNIKDETPAIVITRNEGIVFKIIINQVKKNRTLLLKSLNTAYPPYEVDIADVLEVWQFVNYISDNMPSAEIPLQEMSRSLYEIKAELKRLATKK